MNAPAQGIVLRPMAAGDGPAVMRIFDEGIATGNASMETKAPPWEAWDAAHIAACRIVATDPASGEVLGWAALSPVSGRCVYAGVAEVSVYVAEAARGRGAGRALLDALVAASEAEGYWTLQAGIFPENVASVALHERCGFRIVGTREKLGRSRGLWRDVLLMERRSRAVGRVGEGVAGDSAAAERASARTPGVRIRRYEPSDAATLHAAVVDSLEHLAPWMPWAHPGYAIEESRAWLTERARLWDEGREFEFAIVDDDGRYLGGCGINRVDVDARTANLGYWVRRDAEGRGVATAAARQAIAFAFSKTALTRLTVICSAENRRSQRVALRSGARFERRERAALQLQGRAHDVLVYVIDRE